MNDNNQNNKNNWEIDWDNFLKESEKERLERKLKSSKSSAIAFIKEKNSLNRWDIYHAHWETYLNPHEYWKNWEEKINSFKTEKEVNFYTDRLQTFIDFVEKYTRKDINKWCGQFFEDAQEWDPAKTPQMIEQELKRLENISEEEFNKTDKWRKSGSVFKELSVDEMLNDPWFSKQIDNLFSLEKNPTPPQNCSFCSKTIDFSQCVWTKEKYFCNSDCMKGRKKETENTSIEGKNSVSTNNPLDKQKTSMWVGKILGGIGVGLVGLLVLLIILRKWKNSK